MSMIKLQNNFTTPEQSKQLLDLGFPIDSADCYYDTYDIEYSNCLRPYFLDERTYTNYFKYLSCIGTNVHCPCWTVGRLIEIWDICVNLMPDMDLDLNNKSTSCTYIELIIGSFELAKDDGLIDFSKLEE